MLISIHHHEGITTMKRIIVIVLSVTFVLGLTACDPNQIPQRCLTEQYPNPCHPEQTLP